MQITASALTAEALKLTMPASVFSRSTESHNQDKVSMGTIAARDACAMLELTETVLAVVQLALCQAVRSPPMAKGAASRTQQLHQASCDSVVPSTTPTAARTWTSSRFLNSTAPTGFPLATLIFPAPERRPASCQELDGTGDSINRSNLSKVNPRARKPAMTLPTISTRALRRLPAIMQ